MALQTATPTRLIARALLQIILGWFQGTAPSATIDTDYDKAVAKAQADVLEAGKKTLPRAAQKVLENSLTDFSGV